jgi:hypothetical protein
MGWYCKGFSFNEIEHAYRVSRDMGVPVEHVFELLAEGKNWGEIKKILEDKPVEDRPVKTKKPK